VRDAQGKRIRGRRDVADERSRFGARKSDHGRQQGVVRKIAHARGIDRGALGVDAEFTLLEIAQTRAQARGVRKQEGRQVDANAGPVVVEDLETGQHGLGKGLLDGQPFGRIVAVRPEGKVGFDQQDAIAEPLETDQPRAVQLAAIEAEIVGAGPGLQTGHVQVVGGETVEGQFDPAGIGIHRQVEQTVFGRTRRDGCEPQEQRCEESSQPDHRFMKLKNSALVLVAFILSSMNSIAWASSIGCSSLRRIQTFCSWSWPIISSSRRVPERLMSIAG